LATRIPVALSLRKRALNWRFFPTRHAVFRRIISPKFRNFTAVAAQAHLSEINHDFADGAIIRLKNRHLPVYDSVDCLCCALHQRNLRVSNRVCADADS
jgi:hypothetical protein